MTDMQASITTNMGNTPRAMSEVRAGMDAIEASTKRASKAGKDYQAEISKGLVHVGGKAKELSHALSRLGTPAGGVLHHVFGGADSEFARVAVAAGVLGVAVEAGRKVMEKIVEDTKQAVEWTNKYAEAKKKADKIEQDQADKGAGRIGSHRKLAAAGGEEALNRAQSFAEMGVDEQSASNGVADAFTRFKDPRKRHAALSAAMAAFHVGVPFDEAMQQIPTGMDLTNGQFRENQVARIFAKAGGFRGDALGHYRDAKANVSSDRYISAVDSGNGLKAQVGAIEEEQATTRYSRDQRESLAAARNPESAANIEVNRDAQKQIALMQQMVTALNRIANDPYGNPAARAAAASAEFLEQQKLYNFQKNYALGLQLGAPTQAGRSFSPSEYGGDVLEPGL